MTSPLFPLAESGAALPAAAALAHEQPSEQAMLDELAGVDEFAFAILHELAAQADGSGLSLPGLGKRLGLGASVLLRQLSTMGEVGEAGPGWVRVERDAQRWVIFITETGRAQCGRWLALLARAQAMARGQEPAQAPVDVSDAEGVRP
ncbi:MAG: hypothetical protein QM617_02225 [Comamonas sp.]